MRSSTAKLGNLHEKSKQSAAVSCRTSHCRGPFFYGLTIYIHLGYEQCKYARCFSSTAVEVKVSRQQNWSKVKLRAIQRNSFIFGLLWIGLRELRFKHRTCIAPPNLKLENKVSKMFGSKQLACFVAIASILGMSIMKCFFFIVPT